MGECVEICRGARGVRLFLPVNARSQQATASTAARSTMMSGGVQDIIDQQVAGALLSVEAALDDEMNRMENLNVCRRRHTCQHALTHCCEASLPPPPRASQEDDLQKIRTNRLKAMQEKAAERQARAITPLPEPPAPRLRLSGGAG